MLKIFIENSGLNNKEWTFFVIRSIIIFLIMIIISSIFSYGFYHYDEHYQIIEYVGYKMGKCDAKDLPWEFNARIRPWLQPSIYYMIAKFLNFIGIENPFILTTFFRLFTGFIGTVAIFIIILLSYYFYPYDFEKRKYVTYIAMFLSLIPYLLVRTSSESFSSSFVMIGIGILLLLSKKNDEKNIDFSKLSLFISGFIFGLAFQFRYQIAFFIVGLFLWIIFFSCKEYLKNFLKFIFFGVGFLIAIGVGIIVDYWGYGEWVISFWNYFYSNIISKVSENFGTDPFWGYLYIVNLNFIFPITIFITVTFFIYWLRYPKNLFTFMTFVFFIVHSLISHKEARFLFPMLLFTPFVIVDAYSPGNDRLNFFGGVWGIRNKSIVKIFYILNIIFLIGLIFIDIRFDLPIQRIISFKYKDKDKLFCIDKINPYNNYGHIMNFYIPKNLELIFIDKQELSEIITNGKNIIAVANGLKSDIVSNDKYVVKILYQKFPNFLIKNRYFYKILNYPKIKNKIRYYTLYQITEK